MLERKNYNMKAFISIVSVLVCSHVFGQIDDQFSIKNFPKTIQYSSDTIKDIYVYVQTHKETEYDYDTIIHLDKSMFQNFIKDFNKNQICDPQTKQRNFHKRKLRHKYYVLEFLSTNNKRTFYYFKNNIMGLSVLWSNDKNSKPVLHSQHGQVSLYYKMNSRHLLEKYNLTID